MLENPTILLQRQEFSNHKLIAYQETKIMVRQQTVPCKWQEW